MALPKYIEDAAMRYRLDKARELSIDPAVIAARSNLLDFTTYTMPTFKVNWHHSVACEYLDKFISGEIRRLMVFMPPRHGKSELVSRRLPAYCFGVNPNMRIIATSYGADLASSMNRDVQQIIDSPSYAKVFPDTRLFGANIRTVATGTYLRNSDIFEIVNHKGYYKSAGIGGAITGRGGDRLIIDDPIKNRDEANSITYREKVWNWYKGVFYTRQEENAGILITVTRWHEDDLAGRLLEFSKSDPEADKWTVLRLPAVYEVPSEEYPATDYDSREINEPLWNGKYNSQQLASIRVTLGSYEWNAQYQQRPKAPEGNRFKRHWFEIVDNLPGQLQLVRYWDKGGTQDGGTYTAGVLIAHSRYNFKFYVIDSIRGQWSSFEREQVIKQTAMLDRERYEHVKTYVEQEPGSGGKESAENTIRNLAGFSVWADRPSGDKDTRLEPFAAQAEAGNVHLLKGNWNYGWLEEITAIPYGVYRDQGDATSGAFNRLTAGGRIENAQRQAAPMRNTVDDTPLARQLQIGRKR